MPIYHKKLNGRKVWWVRVVYRDSTRVGSVRPGKLPRTLSQSCVKP